MTDLPPPGCPAVRSGHFPLLINSAVPSPQALQGASISYNSVGFIRWRACMPVLASTDTFRSVMLTGACLGKFELLLQRG
jgi:hypothetical protein